MSLRLSIGNAGIVLGVRTARRVLFASVAAGLTFVAARIRAGTMPVPDGVVATWLRWTDGPVKRTAESAAREVAIDVAPRPVATLDERYLSVAIDSSQLVGGHWWSPDGSVEAIGRRRVAPIDLARARLRDMARELAPAYLRVGGTEADRIFYAVGDDATEPAPLGSDLVLTNERWSGLVDFAKGAGLDLFFTLNAGPSTRDDKGRWTTANAEKLLRHAQARGDHIAALELGNEINGYWFTYGLSQQPDGATVAGDLDKLRAVATTWQPGALVVGPAEFYWPRVGSPFASRTHVLGGLFAGSSRPSIDAVTWHYYPVQSRRCPIATRRATLTELLDPAALDEVTRWAEDVETATAHAAPVWMSETGGAQCGGEPGVSDRFASSLWWMDELGLLARRGQPVVVRQTLVGSNYGLLDEATLDARPDYFASLLFKRLMGRVVLDVHRREGSDPYLRVYAHCTAERAGKPAGSLTLLAINLHEHDRAAVQFPGAVGAAVEQYEMSARSLDSGEALLNGRRLPPSASPRELMPRIGRFDGSLEVPPLSYQFAVIDADAPACRSR
jgi:heparanase 1